MKTISGALQTLLASDSANIATCWQITRGDGTVLGFTDWDQDQTYGGVTFKASTGYTRTALTQMADLSVPNLEVDGMVSSGAITDEDIRNGLYDYAAVLIFMMVPGDANASTYGIVKLRRGWLGQVTLTENAYKAEILGLTQLLSQNFIELHTVECQADLGDSRCKVVMTSLTDTGTITGVTTAKRVFQATMSTGRAAGFYSAGLLTWSTGANAALKPTEVKTWDGTNFTLYLPASQTISIGDTFSVQAGCDKTFNTCKNTYNNVINRRAFDYMPGLDKTVYPQAPFQNG